MSDDRVSIRLHPPHYWKRQAVRHVQKGQRELARYCAMAADSSAMRLAIANAKKQKR